MRGSRVAHGRCGAAYVTSYFWVALSIRGVFSLSLWRDSATIVPTAAIGDRLLGGASSPGARPCVPRGVTALLPVSVSPSEMGLMRVTCFGQLP